MGEMNTKDSSITISFVVIFEYTVEEREGMHIISFLQCRKLTKELLYAITPVYLYESKRFMYYFFFSCEL